MGTLTISFLFSSSGLFAGYRGFADIGCYRGFVAEVVGKINVRNVLRIDTERPAPRTLPPAQGSQTCGSDLSTFFNDFNKFFKVGTRNFLKVFGTVRLPAIYSFCY